MKAFSIIFFRFFNFSLIVGLLIYIFKKYILPDLSILVHEKKSLEKKRSTKQHLLEETLSTLTNLATQEQFLYEQLQEKIIKWKVIEEQKKQVHKHVEEIIQSQLEKRYLSQMEHKNRDAFYRSESLILIDSLTTGVQKKYADQKNREDFCKIIFKHMHSLEYKE